MNRFTQAIDRTRTKIEAIDDSEKLAELDTSLNIDFEEHFEFQQTQARAHAMGKITADEAQVLYMALGESCSTTNGGWAKSADLATKVIVTQVISELLQMRVAGRI